MKINFNFQILKINTVYTNPRAILECLKITELRLSYN
jgi:hypothetical protein